VTITGTVTATGVTIQQATVTQGTTPWTVSFSQGTQVVSLTTAAPWPVTYSAGTQVVSLSTATPWPVTLTNPTVALATGQIVSVTQATTPWTVTYSAGTQPVTFTTAVVSFSGVQPVTVTAIPGQALDPTFNAARVAIRPLDYQNLGQFLGHYSVAKNTSTTVSIGAGGTLAYLRWTDSSRYCVPLKVRVSAVVASAISTGTIVDVGLFQGHGSSGAGSGGNSVVPGTTNKARAAIMANSRSEERRGGE